MITPLRGVITPGGPRAPQTPRDIHSTLRSRRLRNVTEERERSVATNERRWPVVRSEATNGGQKGYFAKTRGRLGLESSNIRPKKIPKTLFYSTFLEKSGNWGVWRGACPPHNLGEAKIAGGRRPTIPPSWRFWWNFSRKKFLKRKIWRLVERLAKPILGRGIRRRRIIRSENELLNFTKMFSKCSFRDFRKGFS